MTATRQFNAWEFRGRPSMFQVVVDSTRIQTSNKAKPSGKQRPEPKRLRELPKNAGRLKWEKFGTVQRARFEGGWLVQTNAGSITHVPDAK